MSLLKMQNAGRQVKVLFLKLALVRRVRTANTVFFFNLIVSTESQASKHFVLNGKTGKVHLRFFILKQ